MTKLKMWKTQIYSVAKEIFINVPTYFDKNKIFKHPKI